MPDEPQSPEQVAATDLLAATAAGVAAELLTEFRGQRADMREVLDVLAEERKGRALSEQLAARSERLNFRLLWAGRVLAALAIIASVLYVGSLWHEAEQDCATRTQSRADVRGAISAATDELAKYAQLTPEKRAEVNDRIRIRVLDEFPPPSC